MKNILLIMVFISASVINAQQKLPFQLEKGWELTGLENPESIVLDTANNVLYVSNVKGSPGDKDGNGYISKASLDGKIMQQKWVTGFNAPKGLVIFNHKLYVTDIDNIVEIDIKTQKKTTYQAKGATFLNDITSDKNGNIYASNTFGFSGIYKLPAKGKRMVELWLKDENLHMPNGLFVVNNELFSAGWGIDMNPATYKTKTNGNLVSINLKTKAITQVTKPIGNLDGLSETIHGFLMTNWLAGKLLYYSNATKKTTVALDLPKGSADTYFDKKTKTIYIPLMLNNKVVTYQFKK
ncbi:MAG: SMP-30/gluconolactonase/LRE family protein [Polaribacter sp.]